MDKFCRDAAILILLIVLVAICFLIWDSLQEAANERMAERIRRDCEQARKEVDKTIQKIFEFQAEQ
jgi:predicted PurR-regulated permease PerM